MGSDSTAPRQQQFLKVGAVAKILKLSVTQVRAAADRGEIPSVRLDGNVRRFRRAEILARAETARATGGVLDEGAREALAFGLMRDGRTDVEIVEALRIPLKLVRAMRREFETPADAPRAEDEHEAPSWSRSRLDERHRALAARRAARESRLHQRRRKP